jgi:hypothetical protein
MGRRKKQGSTVFAIRVVDRQIAEYLSTLAGKARAEAIREALGEWFDQTLEGVERKERALLRDSDRLKDDAELLNLWLIKERRRRAEFAGKLEADRVRRQQAVLDALTQRRREGKTVAEGWIDSPAGLAWCASLEIDKVEALELAKRGVE